MPQLKKTTLMAVPYLRQMLLGGAMPAKKAIAEGIAWGYTKHQLQKAKILAGIKSVREGATGGGMRRWWWTL